MTRRHYMPHPSGEIQQFFMHFEYAWMEGLRTFKILIPYHEFQDSIFKDAARQARFIYERQNA